MSVTGVRWRVSWVLVGATLALVGSACTTKSLDVEAGSPSTVPRPTVAEREANTSTTRSVPPSSTTTVAPAPTSTEIERTESLAGEPGSRAGTCPSDATIEDLQQRFGNDPTGLPPAEAMTAILDLLALYVPPDLAADYQIMRDALMQFFAAFEAVGPDPSAMTPEQFQQFFAALEGLDTPEIVGASQRVEDYFKQACPGFDWDGQQFDPNTPTFD